MTSRLLLLPLGLCLVAATPFPVPPKAERGKVGAACRSGEPGPAVRIRLEGLKDHSGLLRVELYPSNDKDFLAADKLLIAAGKPFRRVEVQAPSSDPVTLCIRTPGPGRYALAIHHDRDGDGKFSFIRDGVGFPGNPRLGTSKPAAAAASLSVGNNVAGIAVRMNYRRGLGFGPLAARR